MNYLQKAFLVNFADYENLGFNLPINIVLLVFFAGMCIGLVALDFSRKYMRLTVRQLLRHDAVGQEKAVTLSKVGLGQSRIVRLFLSGSGHLCRVVKRVGQTEYTYDEYVALQKSKKLKKEKIDFSSALFYIATDMLDRANNINNNYRTSAVKCALACVFMAALYICLMLLMPELLNLLNSAVGAMNG